MVRHYLDAASASPLRPAARAATLAALDQHAADPGRIHQEGLATRFVLEQARTEVAAFFQARPREVVFTSSASEAITAVVRGQLQAVPGGAVVATAVEHSAVRLSAGDSLVAVEVSSDGLLDTSRLQEELHRRAESSQPVALVACQLANHEMGAIQPVNDVAAECHSLGIPLLVDAAQAAGRMPISFADLGADFMALSGPKLGAPLGTGALLIKRGRRIPSLISGGDQERGRRAGLENTPGAAGLGAVCQELGHTLAQEIEQALRLTDPLRAHMSRLDGVEVIGPLTPSARTPHLVCVTIAGVEPQAVLLGLDRVGVAAHSGSACASEDLKPSPVLQAMGVEADRSLRLSVSWASTQADIDAAMAALPSILAELHGLRR